MPKTTVPEAVSPRALRDDKAILPWARKEITPLLNRVREALNIKYTSRYTVSTAGTGAFTNIWTSDSMPTGSHWFVECDVQGFVTSGTAQRNVYKFTGSFYNNAGTVSQQGATNMIYAEESVAAADVRLQVSGQTVQVDVKDDGVSTFAWVAVVHVLPSKEI